VQQLCGGRRVQVRAIDLGSHDVHAGQRALDILHREQGLARAEPGAPGPDTIAERTGS
jgi:hypothetical protein